MSLNRDTQPRCSKIGCRMVVMMDGWRCHFHRDESKFPAEVFSRFSDPIVIETRKEERARKTAAIEGRQHALREAVNEGMEKFGWGFFMIDPESRAVSFKIDDDRDVQTFIECASKVIPWESSLDSGLMPVSEGVKLPGMRQWA